MSCGHGEFIIQEINLITKYIYKKKKYVKNTKKKKTQKYKENFKQKYN